MNPVLSTNNCLTPKTKIMKHYLTEQEFKETLLKMEIPNSEISIAGEYENGEITHIRFRCVFFFYKIYLYTYPMTNDIGMIQEDIDNGWDETIHNVFSDFEDCGIRLFFE